MFAAAEFRQGSSPRTIQRRLSALRSFFNFLLRERALDANPAVGVQAPKARKRLPDTMDVDLMTRLLDFRTDDAAGRARQGDHGAVLFVRAASRPSSSA